MDRRKEATDFYNYYAGTWYPEYMRWLIAGEIIGCLMIAGSVTVASGPDFIAHWVDMKSIAFFVAVLGGINTFIDPMGRAQAYGMGLTNLTIAFEELNMAPLDDPNQEEKLSKLRSAAAAGLTNLRQRSVAQRPAAADKAH